LLIALTACAAGCAATPLQAPEANSILVTRNPPSEGCRFIGEVRGSQGNFVTSNLTKDENLVIGARNQMRDAAYDLGANYVQVELENLSHNTADDSFGGVYNATVIGNAYLCPELPDLRRAQAGH
jgi:hypothetical protein